MFIKLCLRIFSFSLYPVVFKNPDSCSVPVHVPADVGCYKFSKHDIICLYMWKGGGVKI